jgi:hypothetical protein
VAIVDTGVLPKGDIGFATICGGERPPLQRKSC